MKLSLNKQGLLKAILGFSAASWISASINFFILPISTRIFEPNELASINLFYSTFTILMWFACFGFDQGYIRFYNEMNTEKEKRYLLSICMAVSCTILTVITILAIPMQTKISLLLFDKENSIILLLLFICALNAIILRYISLLHRLNNSILYYTITAVCASAVIKVSYLGAALYDGKYHTAIIFMVITSIILIVLGLSVNRSFISWNSSAKTVLTPSLIKFSIPFMPISVMALLNNDLPQYLLRSLSDLKELGVFTTAVTMAGIITLLQSGLNIFWGPYVFKNYKNESSTITKMHEMIVLAMVVFAIVIIATQDIIVLLLGEKYRTVTEFLPILLITPVSYTIAETTGVGIFLEKKSYINLVLYIFSILINLAACFLFIPKLDALGAAISSGIAAISMLILKTVYGQKYFKSVRQYRYLVIGMTFLIIVICINVLFQEDKWFCIFVNTCAVIGLFIIFDLKKIKTIFNRIKVNK